MKIIVDANVVFSAILKTNGKIGDLLINSNQVFDFIAPFFLKQEIRKHYAKLVTISGLTLKQVCESEFQVTKDITFISEEQIEKMSWIQAFDLVKDIDPKDAIYLAFSKHFNCKLWTGDRQLTKALLKKGIKAIISTEELFELREMRKPGKYKSSQG